MTESLDIRLLGPLDVRLGDVAVELGGAKPRAILASLSLQAGRVVSVDQLVEAGWGPEAPLRAVNSVPVYISQLRKALGASRIETRAPGYALVIDPVELDLSRFEDQVRAASIARSRGDHAAAASLLREALALWRGPALADLIAEPFLGEAARLDEARLVAMEDRVEAELALGAHHHLVGELEALVAAHPLRERLRAQLMLALYRSDRQAEALRAYQDLRRVLGEELGIEPSRELASLEEGMLLQRPELEWRAAPTAPPAPGRPAPVAARPARPSPAMLTAGGAFVGRDEELARLAEIWERVTTGRLEMAVVAGESGIGKTRLVGEFADQVAATGATILYGRCDDEATVPYRPFVEALRLYVEGSSTEELRALSFRVRELVRVVPELSERLPELEVPRGRDSDTERYFLFEAVVALLAAAAANAPVVLILDDLHWADKPSRLLLRHVTQRLIESPVFVIITSRDMDLLTEVDRERRAHRIRLGGLGESDVAALLKTWNDAAPPALIKAILTETDGNPFFVGEVLRHLNEMADTDDAGAQLGIPEGVRELLRRRLERVSPDAARLLSVAAVIGREFDVTVLEAVVDEIAPDHVLDALEELDRAGLLAEMQRPPGRYRFAHNLVREAIYEELSPTRRARMHQDVGNALERMAGDRRDRPYAELAHHFSMAAPLGETARAIDYAKRAAEGAVNQVAYDSAINYYRRALELVGEAPTVERVELLLSLGDAEWRVASTSQAPRTFMLAAEGARVVGDPELLARAAVGRGGGHLLYFFETGMVDNEGIALLEEALDAIGPADSPVRVEMLGALARMLYLVAPLERRAALVNEALAMAERIGDLETMAVARFHEYNALRTPYNVDQRLEQANRLLNLALELNDRELLLTCHLFRVMELLELGDIDGVDAEFEPQVQLATELRQPNLVWITTLHRAMRATLDGRFDEAETLAQEALELGLQTEMTYPAPVYGGQIAVLRTLQGRAEEIEAATRALVTAMPFVPAWRAGLAFALVESGRLDQLPDVLADVVPVAEVPHDLFFPVYLASMAEVCAAAGDTVRGAEIYEALAPIAANNITLALGASCWGSAAHYLGVLAASLGRLDDADAHFQMALDKNGRMGAWPLVARTQVAYARVLLIRDQPGDSEHADSLLDAAEEIAEELRMVSLGLRAQELRNRPSSS